ncbi:MAG TPA: hypothetical protein V6D47_16120 [Oscillatoriaceae cyanobacterium]
MNDRGPNWGLAFGSGAFLLVWCVGFTSGVPIEVVAVRAAMATILGALVGILVGQTMAALRRLAVAPPKGAKVDFTLPADEEELQAPIVEERKVAKAEAPPEPAGFEPLDFKKAARKVESVIQE